MPVTRKSVKALPLGACLATILLLCGCSTGGALFERPQTSEDVLPPQVDVDYVDEGSVRFIGVDRLGTSYLAAQQTPEAGSEPCLVTITAAGDWAASCSALPVTVELSNGTSASLYREPVEGASSDDEIVGEFVVVH